MKKFLFLGLAAMMAFTSCTKDETLATAQNGAIGFDVAADKATRAYDPSTTTETIDNFAVYGWMNTYTGVVFDNEVVTKNGGAWTYTNTQYWTPNNYYFAALSPSKSNGGKWTLAPVENQAKAELGIGTVTFPNDGKQDLLYWAGNYNYVGAETPVQGEQVAIEFKHLLSKVQFSFTNGFANDNATVRISNVKINNAETEGFIDLAVADWWTEPAWSFTNTTNTQVLDFGNVVKVSERTSEFSSAAAEEIPVGETYNSDHEMLLFPAKDKTYNVTFTAELLYGGVVAATYEHKVEVATTLNMGYAYNFKAEINAENITGSTDPEDQLKPIEFTVTVKEWDQAGDVTLPKYEPTIIKDAAELAAAFAKGGNILLANDITIPATVEVPAGVVVNLDLNGKTLTNNSTDLGYGVADVIVVHGELTINGEGTVTGPTRCVWARSATAKVTINGGNYVGALQDSFQDVAIYASGDGVVNIYGGTFETVTADTESYATDIHSVLNVYDKKGTINVYGGTFKGQNPAEAGTEPAGYNNFVAAGYKSVETTTGVWEVVAE